MNDLSADNLRILILARCAAVAKMDGEPKRMVEWIEQTAALNADFKIKLEAEDRERLARSP